MLDSPAQLKLVGNKIVSLATVSDAVLVIQGHLGQISLAVTPTDYHGTAHHRYEELTVVADNYR